MRPLNGSLTAQETTNMSNLTIGATNAVDSATFSYLVGSENSQFPLTNISKVFTTKSSRSNEANVTIQIDLGSAQSVDTVMMVGNNLTGLGIDSATVEFSLSTIFPGTNIETIDLSADHNVGFKFLGTTGSFRYAKLTLTGTSYCEVSNIYIGERTTIATNLDTQSFKHEVKHNQKVKRNDYGQEFIDKYNSTNSITGQLKLLSPEEFEDLQYLYTSAGTDPVWVIVDSEGVLSSDGSSKYLFSGYYRMGPKMSYSTPAYRLFDTSVSFREVI